MATETVPRADLAPAPASLLREIAEGLRLARQVLRERGEDEALINTPRARAWQFTRSGRQGLWQGSDRAQSDRYMAAVAVPTCRNRGPKGPRIDLTRKTWHVVHDVTPVPGTMYGAATLPEGAVLKDQPVLPALHSRRQGRAALAIALRRWPDAKLICIAAGKGTTPRPGTIAVPPDTPPDWWVRHFSPGTRA